MEEEKGISREDFYQRIYEIVRQIPPGMVCTYGRLAVLSGYPERSRMAGRAMACCPDFLDVPCHRVVNSQGRTVPDWIEQPALLRAEGVSLRPNGCVNLKKHLWP